MSGHCKNCGTPISDGFCPNCEEEAFIAETQSDFLPDDLSDDFVSKVDEQRAACKRRAKAGKISTDTEVR